jgi:HSP20 family molecular chaperone IbpA
MYRHQPYVLVDMEGQHPSHHHRPYVKFQKKADNDANHTSETKTKCKTKEKRDKEENKANQCIGAALKQIAAAADEVSNCRTNKVDTNPAVVDSNDTAMVERHPVHRTESEEAATIALDVSGFTPNQLHVSLEEDCIVGKEQGGLRPILTVRGERVNALGDKYKIHRRFLLERENLAGDIQSVDVRANFGNDGILSITVPKKKKEEARPKKPTARSIAITTANGEPRLSEEMNVCKSTSEPQVETVDEKDL